LPTHAGGGVVQVVVLAVPDEAQLVALLQAGE
jgi:hypothetical protein